MAPENPAAFPTHHKTEQMTEDGYRDAFYSTGGMELRDYFAAAAVSCIASNTEQVAKAAEAAGVTAHEGIAIIGYSIADAMLTERMKAPR